MPPPIETLTASSVPRTSRGRRALRLLGAAIAALAVLTTAYIYGGLRWNSTPSLPIGFYRVSAVPTAIVAFCPREPWASLGSARGYRSFSLTCADHRAALLKPVAAVAGDIVEVREQGIAVNGRLLPNTAQFRKDNHGRPLTPWPAGRYKVAPNTFWALSTYNKYSFDSRYFGPVDTSDIIDYVTPVWTTH